MIVDDEMPVRKLLQASINWESLGLEVVGEAASGIEAINIIDDVNPDIVFVDINMPFMNGIEFTKMATSRYPDLYVIVLTGFDDFEYARECVRLPVVEYMLKPIVRSEVESVLKRLVDEIDKKMPDENCSEQEESALNSFEIQNIVNFLKTNYKDSTINLASVAQQFGFNACYLSRKFKKEIGVSFLEYLTKCRMEHAIELKKSNLKMFETANEVGIPDPNYFGRCFKKYTGVSYSEYI
jgi:YesN/AraC family two-component response regulator